MEIGTAETTEEEKTGDTEDTVYHLEEAGDEIRSLMEAYFKARRTCDINGLADVYGDSASPEELREESLRTVSYTHLDVYKRQVIISLGLSTIAVQGFDYMLACGSIGPMIGMAQGIAICLAAARHKNQKVMDLSLIHI